MTSAVIDAGDGLPLTLPALWRRQVQLLGDRTLLVCDHERLTYKEADKRSRQLARGLLAAGASKGSHVALLYPMGADFLIAMLAASRIGAVVVPLSTLSTADELRWLLAHSDTEFLLATTEFRSRRYDEVVKAAIPELDFSRSTPTRSLTAPWFKHVWFSESGTHRHGASSIAALESLASKIDDTFLDAVEARVSPADRFVIIHTSGTTASPKGVIHTHGALIRHVDNGNKIRQYAANDVLFSTAPWFWVAGFAFALLGTIVAGLRIVCSNATVPSEVLDLLERERPTITNGYSSTVAKVVADPSFAKRDLTSIRRGTIHSILAPDVRPKDPELRHNIYGMTEAGGALTMTADESDLPERMRGACGKVMPGFEAKLVDPDTGKTCKSGEIGELWIRGPFLMEGYYGKARSQVFDPDGWWRSGDLGMIDAEGFFYIKGRLSELIKTSGANVSPKEVEAALRDLTGGLENFVVGVPDAQRGQAVTALIVADDYEFDEPALKQRLGEKLSSYKVPRRIFRISRGELPFQSSGKLDARKLAQLAQRLVNS
jgi:acyl-CoA synthetase (AMP-forming)/AMP-acid ligase II